MNDTTPRRAMPGPDKEPSGSGRRLAIIALSGALVLGLGYGATQLFNGGTRSSASDTTAGPSASTTPGSSASGAPDASGAADATSSGDTTPSCQGSSLIAVDPSWAAAMQKAAEQYKVSASDGCAAIEVSSVSDAQVLKSGLGGAKAWVPEDPSVIAGSSALAQGTTTVVGSTPLVLVAQKQVQQALGTRTLTGTLLTDLASGQKQWNQVVKQDWGPMRLVLPAPASRVSGAIGFQAIASSVAGGGTPTSDLTKIQSNLLRMAQVQYHVVQEVASDSDVTQHLAAQASDDTGRGKPSPRVGVTTQYALLQDSSLAGKVTGTPLVGGAVGVQLGVDNAGNDSQVANFITWLKSDVGQEALAAQGVTTTGRKPSASALGALGLPAAMPASVASNASAILAQARQMYQGFSVRANTTTVVDASGSMADKLPGGTMRKIDLLSQASVSMWSQWPDGSSSGVFTFNADANNNPKITNIVPWITAGQPGSTAQMVRYGKVMQSVKVGGGTPLYQAILTGYQYALKHYQAGKLNQVVVVTDGADQDAKESVNLQQLIATLQKADPKKPIKMRYMALGPTADFATLQKIATQTGGTVAAATTELQLPQVLSQLFMS